MSQPASAAKTILLVEDDCEIARLLGMLLRSEGFAFNHIDRGDLAVEAIRAQMPDMVILDVMLPGMNGVDICRTIRAFYPGGILMLTACEDDITEIASLNVGADDYLVKPIRPHVLLARLQALLRRINPPPSPHTTDASIHCGALSIDPQARSITIAGETLDLTTAEYDLLLLLAQNPGKIISRSECFQSLRGIEYDGLDRSIDMRLSALRKKIKEKTPELELIKTVRGKGYLLVAD